MIRTWLEKRGWKVFGPSDVTLDKTAWIKGSVVTCGTLDALFLESEALEDESKELRTAHNAQMVKYIDLAEQHEKLTAERDLLREALIEAACWIPGLDRKSPRDRGAKCQVACDAKSLAVEALSAHWNSKLENAIVKDQAKDPELEIWLCPVHRSLDDQGKLEPLDNCVACLRAERNELLRKLGLPVPAPAGILPQEHPNTHAEDYLVYSIEDAREGLNGSILWWKPQACGYTYELDLAGKHTKEKWGHHNVSERHQKMVRVDDAAKVARHIVVVLESDLPRQSNLDCRTEAHHEG